MLRIGKKYYLVYEGNALDGVEPCYSSDFALYANKDAARADANQRIEEYIKQGDFTIVPEFVGTDIRDNHDKCVFLCGDVDNNSGYFYIAVIGIRLFDKEEKK